MSQQKVDNRKKEKYNRKAAPKKAQIKTILGYVAIALIGIAILVYLGYSIAVSTGMYTPPETTTTYASEVSASDLRKQLIEAGDSNVKDISDEETKTPIEGAEFELYRRTITGYSSAGPKYTYTLITRDVTDSNGQIVFPALFYGGTYVAREVATDDYHVLRSSDNDYVIELDKISVLPDGMATNPILKGYASVTVENTPFKAPIEVIKKSSSKLSSVSNPVAKWLVFHNDHWFRLMIME